MPINQIIENHSNSSSSTRDLLQNESILEAIQNGDKEAILKAIETTDLDTYIEIDGETVLLSGFLLNFFLNPYLQGGEEIIRAVMEKQPNLDMPLIKNGKFSEYELLIATRKDLIENPSEENAETMNRIDLITSYLDRK